MSGYKVLIPSTDPARASATIDDPATADDLNEIGRPRQIRSSAGGADAQTLSAPPCYARADDHLRLSAPGVVMVMCDIVVFALAPCQWRSPALICTTSPTLISRSSCSVATMPLPAVMTRI